MRQILVLFVCFSSLSVSSQTDKYWVFFEDKEGVEFDPYAYFDEKAIERRLKLGLELDDQTDYPIKEEYIAEVTDLVESVSWGTRWFNALSVLASVDQIDKVKSLPCVREVQTFPNENLVLSDHGNFNKDYVSEDEREMLEAQTQRMGRRDFSAKI